MSDDSMPPSFSLPTMCSSDLPPHRYGEGGLWRAEDFLQATHTSAKGSSILPFHPITLLLDWDEQFLDRLRQIYLHGIFGRFSILVKGVFSEKDWEQALSLCYRSFCELSEENREFNGYLPRGILIDCPMCLCWDSLPTCADFYCLDYHRLCKLWGGGDSAKSRHDAEERMGRLLHRRRMTDPKLLFRQPPDAQACEFLLLHGIEEVFLPDAYIPKLRERLKKNSTENMEII